MVKKALWSTALFTLVIINLFLWPYLFGAFDKEEEVDGPVIIRNETEDPNAYQNEIESAQTEEEDEGSNMEEVESSKVEDRKKNTESENRNSNSSQEQSVDFKVVNIE